MCTKYLAWPDPEACLKNNLWDIAAQASWYEGLQLAASSGRCFYFWRREKQLPVIGTYGPWSQGYDPSAFEYNQGESVIYADVTRTCNLS